MTVINKNQYCMYWVSPEPRIQHKDYYQSLWIDDLHRSDTIYYYIEMMNSNTFSYYDIYEMIPKDIMQCIREGIVKLAISNSGHGYHSIVEDVYVNVLLKCKIYPKHLLLLSESADMMSEIKVVATKYNMECCDYMWTTQYEYIMKSFIRYNLSTLQHKDYPKKFLSFNGMFRQHRDAIVFLLESLNILDQGYVSYNATVDISATNPRAALDCLMTSLGKDNERLHSLFSANEDKILKLSKLYIDDIDTISKEPVFQFRSGDNHYYENTYFSVVTETHFPLYKISYDHYVYGHTEVGRLLSEKIFKPIALKHPFIIVSNPRFLELLRSLGYKTFSPLIDESYDLIEDDAERLLAIAYEVKRLCELDPAQLSIFLSQAKEICDYNHSVLLSKTEYKHIRS